MFNVKLNHIMLVLFSRKGCAHSLCTASQPMALTKHRVALEPGHKMLRPKIRFSMPSGGLLCNFFYFLENTAAQMLWSPAYLTQNLADL